MVLKTGSDRPVQLGIGPLSGSVLWKNRKFRKISQKPKTSGSTIRTANRSGWTGFGPVPLITKLHRFGLSFFPYPNPNLGFSFFSFWPYSHVVCHLPHAACPLWLTPMTHFHSHSCWWLTPISPSRSRSVHLTHCLGLSLSLSWWLTVSHSHSHSHFHSHYHSHGDSQFSLCKSCNQPSGIWF